LEYSEIPYHKRTENDSFRLHKDLIAELRRETEQIKISFRTLASYCFSLNH
jgi:ribosome-interacting GTPase 1